MLGLDSMLHFAEKYRSDNKARKVVRQAVKGVHAPDDGSGEEGVNSNTLGWYPFALASITITDLSLRLLKLNSLTYFLLTHSSSSSQDDIQNAFHDLVSLLLLHFHQHWIYLQTSDNVQEAGRARPVVMDFERVVKKWKIEVVRWVERGTVQGWCDSRGLVGV